MVKIGIIGLPYVGKSTIFNALTRAHAPIRSAGAEARAEHVGIVEVPDARLDTLGRFFPEKELKRLRLEFHDFPPIGTTASSELVSDRKLTETMAGIRQCDAILEVVRLFDDPTVPHVAGSIDPVRDIEKLNLDLLISDLDQVEKRLEKVEKGHQHHAEVAIEHERDLLQRLKAILEEERPLRDVLAPAPPESHRKESREEGPPSDEKLVWGFGLLTAKPITFALNVSEVQRLADDPDLLAALKPLVEGRHRSWCEISAKLEMEFSELEPEEEAQFRQEMCLVECGTEKGICACCLACGLISFFTIGDQEIRAWPIIEGTIAHKAAGAVHSDMEKGFVRAEVVHFDDFAQAGSMQAARDQGLLRQEKKEYVVSDGDIVYFKFTS